MRRNSFKILFLILTVVLLFPITGCQENTPTSTRSAITPSIIVKPSDTPEPMALMINGEGISKYEFEAELSRFQTAQTELGNIISIEQASQRVLDEFIDLVLLKQGAEAEGFSVDDAILQDRIDNLIEQIGGIETLTMWEQEHGYTDESLRVSLRRQIGAAWMRDNIISLVPTIAEQVHVQQILAYNQGRAQEAWNQLNSGADFATLASDYDPVTKGELGWFPRDYLPDIQIEEAAFALQPGQYSQVIETIAGYSILMVIEREVNHLLSPDALMTLQIHAIQQWLDDQRQSSSILIMP